ncbi:MAG TPA: protease pro-enzyme activation domain-containing protein, partial [Thermoplasmata archaeon]|nr:protease pro-enzyme activation domain-containing protein [Thermoplasmata archaeon]
MQTSTHGKVAVWGLLVAAMAIGGMALAVPGTMGGVATAARASVQPGLSIATSAGAPAPSWAPSELRAAPEVLAPYSEAGLGLPGATYVGAPSLATAANPAGTINLLVTFQFSNASRLNALLGALVDPASPQYHHYLTADAFNAEFGAAPSVYGSVLAYLESYGVTGVTTHADRLAISFAATPSQAASIFHAPLGEFVSASGQPFYAPLSSPMVPAPLAPYLVDVEGLSNYSAYQNHFAPLSELHVLPAAGSGSAPGGGVHTPLSPGGASNPFSSVTVTSNGLTETYDEPLNLNLSTKTGTCDTNTCGDFVQAPGLQVTYNETGLFQQFGFPKNATVAAILWSDTTCHANTGTCSADSYYNYFCSTLTSGSAAWDFFKPDVTSFWNYSIPAGEPMPRAVSEGITGYTYAYPAGSQGYSASCDSGGAEGENTLDVSMLGAMAPGANVFQVFGGSSSSTAIDTVFADILSPSTTAFSTTGGYDTALNIKDLQNVSVVTNSWTGSSLPAAWTTDLKSAAARGITVLGATGDAGTTLEPPAEIGQNTYGVVAIGGTTAVPIPHNLLRGAPHTASSASPYYGVGRGEIGWYEPSGTVDGFTSTYGGTGGVASSSSSYPRAKWFNASADALAVANAVRSGNYRAEPDIAAISNDTLVDLDQGPISGNFTCWVSAGCTKTAAIAVGTTSGSQPTVEGFYFIGTSIATQVAGGVIATIDYAMHKAGQAWVGVLNPTLYPQGQLQYAGDLSLHSFYDVTTYTDAGGLTANYEAKAGYDLATGWGVLDAGNFTQNVMTYPTTFTESGLPGGTSWSVKVTPTVGDAGCTVSGSSCSNPSTSSSTGTSIGFSETYGRYTYSPSATGYSAAAGSFSVHGAGNAITVTFSQLFAAPSANPNPDTTGTPATISAGASGGSGTYTTYAWSGLPAACGAPGNVASFVCTPTVAGTSTVQVTVTDSNGGQVTASFSWVVIATLVAAPSASVNPVDVGQATTISAGASGGSGGYSYAWSGLPSGCGSPGNTASFVCTPAPGDDAGSPYTVSVTVTDGASDHATASFSLSVDPALSAGTPSASPNPVDEGVATTISDVGFGGGGGAYGFAWSGLPPGCGPETVASFSCTPGASGTFTVSVTVTDGNGNSATASFSLTVNGPISAVISIGMNPVDEGQETTFTAVVGGGSGGYTYAWSGLPSGCGSPGDVVSFSCTPAPGDAAGSPYTVALTVTDSQGGQAMTSTPFTVDPALSVAPSASANPLDANVATTISANAAGGTGSYVSYLWSGDLPAGCSPGSVASFSCTPTVAGTYTMFVSVTDSNDWQADGSFTLVVNGALSASASASTNPVDEGQATTVSAVAGGGSGGYSYAWSGLPSGCGSPGDVASFVCTPAAGDA